MEIRKETQKAPVVDEITASFALIKPVLKGLLYSLKEDVVVHEGGYEKIPLYMLARLYRPGDGDVGICFEYAVHESINKSHPYIIDRIDTALKYCKINGDLPSSLLFGAEKNGALSLVASIKAQLTNESRLLAGTRGKPVKLRKHIDQVAASFRKSNLRAQLPNSICDTWKADLFVGQPSTDQWLATTIKLNERDLCGGRGLRVGIVPMSQGDTDAVRFDEMKNLVICPLPYDASFVELFYRSWLIVKAFLMSDAKMPDASLLPIPADRLVCKHLVERRRYGVLDVIDALNVFAQPYLLESDEEDLKSYITDTAEVNDLRKETFQIYSAISPNAQILK